MLETVLHVGHEHPNLLWVLVPSYVAFLAGIGVGVYSDRVREFVRSRNTTPNE
jgi:hypothetical protein